MICRCKKTKIPDEPLNGDPTQIAVCTNCNLAYQYVKSKNKKTGKIFYDPVPII